MKKKKLIKKIIYGDFWKESVPCMERLHKISMKKTTRRNVPTPGR